MTSHAKAPYEVHTLDGFHSCGTLAECKKAARALADKGTEAQVYKAEELDRPVWTALVKG